MFFKMKLYCCETSYLLTIEVDEGCQEPEHHACTQMLLTNIAIANLDGVQSRTLVSKESHMLNKETITCASLSCATEPAMLHTY